MTPKAAPAARRAANLPWRDEQFAPARTGIHPLYPQAQAPMHPYNKTSRQPLQEHP